MNSFLRLLRKLRVNVLWLAAAVLAGLLLHIGAVLAITHLSPNPAVAALSKLGAANEMVVLPPVTAGHQPLPFMSPAERYAMCRFDLRKGPVALHAVLGGDNWTIAVYGPTGANEYAVAGADLERREVELLLAAGSDGQGPSLPIARDASVTTAVGLASRIGIAIISAPAARSAEGDVIERLLSQASCTQRTRTAAPAG